jgi:tryptophanase
VRRSSATKYLLPAHQGRAAEHLLAKTFVKPGHIVPMNYHFTTTKAHFDLAGGKVLELYTRGAEHAEHVPLQGEHGPGPAARRHEKAGPRTSPSCAWRPPPT